MKFFRNTPFLLAPLLLPGLLFPITVWERETWNGIIEKAAFSSDAKRVACAMAGGRLLVRDMETGEILFEESTQPNSICSVDISSDGQHVVWGDLSGMLYAWNPDDGTSSLTAGQMALSGLAVASDGSNVAVMGDGTQLRIRQVSDFQSVYFKNLNLEQVHALAVDTSGNYILAGDHSGRAALVNRSTGAAASKPITGVGLEGALFLSGAGSQAILWDAEGSLILVDSGLNVIGSVQLGGDTVNKVIQDIAGNRVVIATRSGAILGVNLADLKLDSSPIAALDQSAIGLGIKSDGSILVLDEIGVAWRISGATIEEYRSPFVAGWALRAELSLQSGIATLMTDRGGWVARLSDGNCSSMDPGPGEILLDAAVFHGKSGNCPVRLVLDRETLTLRLRGDCLPEELIIEDWTPTRVACGAWLSRIAIMSSDGTVLVMEEGTDGLLDLYAEDPDQTVIWDDLVFAENDAWVIKTERSVIECIEAPDGPFGLCLSSTGYFQMTGDESNPFFGAYPNLVPSAMGGMDTGVFGNILVARDSWIRHREFGWGYLSPGLESNWYWFQNEGWLAGDQAYQHYLYSPGRKNWIYYLAPDHSTNWVYDFSVPGWRPFAAIGRDR